MIEYANCALAFGNVAMLITVCIAMAGKAEWKEIAMRRTNIIEYNEREIRELKIQNERLNDLVDVLRRTEDE